MKFAIVFAALLAVAFAGENVEIVRQDLDVQPDGYKFGFETSDGFIHDSEGVLKNAGTDNEQYEVQGSYEFSFPNGETYKVTYDAGEGGFKPKVHYF